VPCFDNYINIDESIPSRSGLYADSLPGIDSEMIDGLAKAGKDEDDTWAVLYKRAYKGLVNEAQKLLSKKFRVDLKLVARETSQFKEGLNAAAGLAGVTIEFDLPKYARIHVINAEVFSDQEYETPDVPFYVYEDDENGELLHEFSGEIVAGRSTVNVDTDFEVNKIFVAYDATNYSFRQTENKRYSTPYITWSCDQCAFDCGGYTGKVSQISGGGLNVKYVVYCSIEKFVCENINLFAQALLWKIGVVITEERRYGERLNKFTTMNLTRAEELMEFYREKFGSEITEAIKSQNIREDEFCFPCKHLVSSRSSTP
jgi:hypothetical protein